MKKIALALLSLLACFLVLTSCGEKKNSDGNESKDTETLAVTETAVDTADTETETKTPETDKETEPAEDTSNEMTREELVRFISGHTWHDYFYGGENNTAKLIYTIEFTPNSDKMSFNAGYYESEWINTYSGKYVIGDDGVFSADFYDELRDETMKMTFVIDVLDTDVVNKKISMPVKSTDPAYDALVGKTFEFKKSEAPSYDD